MSQARSTASCTRTSCSSCWSSVGVYFTIRTKGVQIRFIKDMFKQLTEKKHVQGEQLHLVVPGAHGLHGIAAWARATSPAWQRPSPRAARAPCSGCGSWPWWARRRPSSSPRSPRSGRCAAPNGEFRGGPAYYIHQALGKPQARRACSAVLLILCFAFGFNGLQAFNACTSALEYYIPDYATNGVAVGCWASGLVVVHRRRHLRRLEAHQRDHVHHRAGHGHRLHRASRCGPPSPTSPGCPPCSA